jgi:hypothetical protein
MNPDEKPAQPGNRNAAEDVNRAMQAPVRKKPHQKLKTAFFNAPPVRGVFNNAAVLSGSLLTAADIGMMCKNGLTVSLEGGAGMLMVASSLALFISKKKPTLAFRLSGAATVGAALLLSATGFDFAAMKVKSAADMAMPLAGFMPPALLLLFQKEIAEPAKRWANSRNRLVHVFGEACCFPVIESAAIETVGYAGLGYKGLRSGDAMLTGLSAVWLAANFAMMATDPRAQAAFRKEQRKPKP